MEAFQGGPDFAIRPGGGGGGDRFHQSSNGGAQILLNTNYKKTNIAQIKPYNTYRGFKKPNYVGKYQDFANPPGKMDFSDLSNSYSNVILYLQASGKCSQYMHYTDLMIYTFLRLSQRK